VSSSLRVNLDHAHIFASDITATIDFLSRMFGATIVWDEQAAGTRSVRLAIGNGFIHIYDQPPKSERGGPVHHLGIETDDLDGLVERMKAEGFRFRKPVRTEPKFKYVMVAGPDNLLIELFQSFEPERWRIAQ
jgi:catechol 2,3-dioxygenase-like lactoylglutathione lyase family enzyme